MVCPDCEPLAKSVQELKKKVVELEAKLALFTGPHVPSSQKRFPEKKKHNENDEPSKLGRPHGFEGCTRQTPKPDKTVITFAENCDGCGAVLGEPFGFETRVIEEIPAPQPVTVTKFKNAQYVCPCCGKIVTATHPDCPSKGVFGPRATTLIALLKYVGRLPCKLVCSVLERDYGLMITPATVLAINSRFASAFEEEYRALVERVRRAKIIHVDETGFSVGGVNYWLWIFTTPNETLAVIRQSRGKNVLREILGENFEGIIVCDGLKAYPNFTNRIQRCWAHLLREADYAAEKCGEAKGLSKALHALYSRLVKALEDDPPPRERLRLHGNAVRVLRYWLAKQWRNERVHKLAEKIRNGFKHWFTFVVVPNVEPTNNRAERALREHVVQRKIIGCLRSKQGVHCHEVVMSVLASRRQSLAASGARVNECEFREELVEIVKNHSTQAK